MKSLRAATLIPYFLLLLSCRAAAEPQVPPASPPQESPSSSSITADCLSRLKSQVAPGKEVTLYLRSRGHVAGPLRAVDLGDDRIHLIARWDSVDAALSFTRLEIAGIRYSSSRVRPACLVAGLVVGALIASATVENSSSSTWEEWGADMEDAYMHIFIGAAAGVALGAVLSLAVPVRHVIACP